MLKPIVTSAVAAALVLGVSACSNSSSAGGAETDRVAGVVADAIDYPRQSSAAAYARAALDTTAAKDGRLVLVEIEELTADSADQPIARLRFRVRFDGGQTGFGSAEPVTRCYDVRYSRDGLADGPDRVDCPEDARPTTPPALEPTAEAVVPVGSDEALRDALDDLHGRTPSAEAVERRVRAALPDPGTNASTGLAQLRPTVEAAVAGERIGVSVWAAPSRSCLLGVRDGTVVTVWRPSRVQLQPGELTCDPATALGGAGQQPPH